jgi:hypothetical protein|nr:MAG: hypothetical protein [Bacteriophage sp.]DAW05452.1 MAG TPA: hypothetical protein [Caudoviricetes sp.]
MKRVYIQIIDPINGTCVNACHEYPDGYTQAIDATLRQYDVYDTGYRVKVVDEEEKFPIMPEYMRLYGTVSGTSKLINMTIIG